MKYHIQQGGTRLPPATMQELRMMSLEGKLHADAEYWHVGMPDWRPLNELLPGLTPPPPSGPRLLTPPVRRLAKRPASSEDSNTTMIARLHRALLRMVWVFSCLSFFLPVVAVSIPIAGNLEFSMFDLLSGEKSGTGQNSPQEKPAVSELLKVSESKPSGTEKGFLLCSVAILGLAAHYLFSIIWGIVEFVASRPTRRFDAFWLLLGAQFPILMLIGGKMVVKGLVEQAGGQEGKEQNVFAGLEVLFANHIAVTPSTAAWVLFAAALVHLVLGSMIKDARP